MAIQKRALLHFMNFLHQSLMLADSARWFPRLRPPEMEKKLIDPLPFQTSLCLTLTFLFEVVIHNLQNCLCSHT